MTETALAALTQGMALGLGLAFLVGPAFFALLQASIDYGFTVSVAIACGVVCSDVVLMALSWFALRPLSGIPHFHAALAGIGGLVLLVTGVATIRSKPPQVQPAGWQIKATGRLFVKGFSINTFNPFPWMFWLSTAALVQTQFGGKGHLAPFLFFAAAAITVFGTDVAKAGAAHYLLRFLTQPVLKTFRRISGLCLVAFGLKLLWTALRHWG